MNGPSALPGHPYNRWLCGIAARGRVFYLTFVALQFAPEAIFSAEFTQNDQFKLSDVIPSGKTAVEIMAVSFGKRADELNAKLQQAIQTNRD